MSGQDSYQVGYYVVCVIDVLGQKEKLALWSRLPLDGSLTPDLLWGLKKTAGVVIGFAEVFERYFATVAECTMPDIQAKASPQERTKHARFRSCDLRTQQFSDTFVFYAPLANEHGDLSPVAIHRMIGACSTALLTSLAAMVPVRGGITIGTGLELKESNFYGPALAEAHFLESRVAEYPRVVASPQVIRFLDDLIHATGADEITRMMGELAKDCRKQFVLDVENIWMVDFLNLDIPPSGSADAIRSAILWSKAFVESEANRFREQGTQKLADRYDKLKSYFDSRMSRWL